MRGVRLTQSGGNFGRIIGIGRYCRCFFFSFWSYVRLNRGLVDLGYPVGNGGILCGPVTLVSVCFPFHLIFIQRSHLFVCLCCYFSLYYGTTPSEHGTTEKILLKDTKEPNNAL